MPTRVDCFRKRAESPWRWLSSGRYLRRARRGRAILRWMTLAAQEAVGQSLREPAVALRVSPGLRELSWNLAHECEEFAGPKLIWRHAGHHRWIERIPRPTESHDRIARLGSVRTDVQYESVRMRRAREAIEKAVELNQLVRWAAGLLRLALEIQVPSAGLGLIGGSNHSMTSRALRTAFSAPRNDRAISTSAAGLAPFRRSQRRNASHATSAPSRWRSLTISTSERSAE